MRSKLRLELASAPRPVARTLDAPLQVHDLPRLLGPVEEDGVHQQPEAVAHRLRELVAQALAVADHALLDGEFTAVACHRFRFRLQNMHLTQLRNM